MLRVGGGGLRPNLREVGGHGGEGLVGRGRPGVRKAMGCRRGSMECGDGAGGGLDPAVAHGVPSAQLDTGGEVDCRAGRDVLLREGLKVSVSQDLAGSGEMRDGRRFTTLYHFGWWEAFPRMAH